MNMICTTIGVPRDEADIDLHYERHGFWRVCPDNTYHRSRIIPARSDAAATITRYGPRRGAVREERR